MTCFEISAKNGMCFNRKLFNNYSSSLNGLSESTASRMGC